jgi:hypothetical protein
MADLLNGYNLKVHFGSIVNNGKAALFGWAKRKASLTQEFMDENGTQTDLDDPKYEAREIVLHCSTMANSRGDFKQKYFGLMTELQSMGTKEFYFSDPDHTVYLFYKEMRNPRKLSARFDSDNVGMDYDLVFGDTDPTINLPPVYIVTELDEYLIA